MVNSGCLRLVVGMTLCWSSMAVAAQQLEISGRVFDGNGGGVVAATVELQPLLPAHERAERQLSGDAEPQVATRARTDSDGEFVLTAPDAGFWQIVVRHEEYLPASHDLSPLLDDRELADLVMQPRSELVARLVDVHESPVADVELTIRGWSQAWQAAAAVGWWPAARRVRTRLDGIVALPCISLEKVSVAAWRPDGFVYATASCDASQLDLRWLSDRREVLLRHPSGVAAVNVYGFVRWPFVAFGRSDETGRLRGPFDWSDSVPVALADVDAFYGEPRLVAPGVEEPATESLRIESLGETSADQSPEADLPILELMPTVRVRGRAIDTADGRPLPGAWLWVGRGSEYFQVTGRGGEFSLRLPASASASLRFGAIEYLTIAYGPSGLGTGDLEARMTPAMSRPGRVVDAAGDGITGAIIQSKKPSGLSLNPHLARLQGHGQWVLDGLEEQTRDDGTFELTGLVPSRPFELRVSRSGFAVHYEPVVSLRPGEPVDELLITLARGRTGFGRVVTDHEMPIAGAEVQLLPSLTGPAADQTFSVRENPGATTDGEGSFTLHDLSLGTYYLAAKGRGFPELLVPGVEIVDGDGPLDLGTLVLVPGVLLFGRVTDEAGKAIAEAEFSVRKADGEQIVVQRTTSSWFASTTSRQNGSFHLEGLPRGSRLALLVTAAGFLPRVVAVTTGDDDQRLDLTLDAGASVSGMVFDTTGRPAAAATVELRPVPGVRNRSTAVSRSVDTDGEGRFEATGIQPDTYTLLAIAGRMKAEPMQRIVTEDGLSELEFHLRRGASVEAMITDASGAPLQRVMTRARPVEATRGTALEFRSAFALTDSAGLAVLQPLLPGAYEVIARLTGYESASATIEIDTDRPHTLRLRLAEQDAAWSTITGRVIDPSGQPVSGARVTLAGQERRRATSDLHGRFELEASPGEYRLVCRHKAFAGYTGELLTLPKEGLLGVVIELSEGATVVGRVIGLELEDLSQIKIVARGPLQGGDGTEVFGEQYGSINFAGDFRITGLQPGEWRVRAELLNPTRAAWQQIEIVSGVGEVTVDLQFEVGHRLTGSVLEQGQPLAGAAVSLRCSSQFRGETFTDTDGRFAVDHVPDGRCSVTSTDLQSGLQARQDVDVTFDAEIVLEIDQASTE